MTSAQVVETLVNRDLMIRRRQAGAAKEWVGTLLRILGFQRYHQVRLEGKICFILMYNKPGL